MTAATGTDPVLLPPTFDGYSDPELSALAIGAHVQFVLRSPTRASTVIVRDGHVVVQGGDTAGASDFSITLETECAWDDLLSQDPPPRRQHLLAFLRPNGGGSLHGDSASFAQHLHLVRRVVELARPPRSETPIPPHDLSAVHGHYLSVTTGAWGRCDVYVERVGSGAPIVLLPTAGSDGRQYHGLFGIHKLTQAHELITLDLPWHGKSDPGDRDGWWSYRLDSKSYVELVAETIAALGLDRPVVFGASMAGALVLELAAHRPDAVSAVVSAQAGPRVTNRRTEYLRSPGVNQALFIPEWTYGLMSPSSPKAYRDRVWWAYSQGGWGTYDADIAYYTEHWDINHVLDRLTGSVPVVFLSGVYDYSVPPDQTRELADSIPGAIFREMPELGHFPHAENPPVFAEHLLWSLAQLERLLQDTKGSRL